MGGFEVKYDYLHDVELIPFIIVIFVVILIICGILRRDERHYYSLNQTRSEVRTPTRPTSYAKAVQRAASQRVASHRPTLSRREVHFFVQRLVGLFKAQRRNGYQFAVLCLTHKQNFTTIQFRTKMRAVYHPDEATDNSSATFPFHKNLCNYIVARPDGPDHAEAILISRFDMLLRSYQSQNMLSPCPTAVLYTWLLPCEYCTRQIIGKLGKGQSSSRVVVIYTSKMPDVTDEQETVRRLKEAGITVIKENYDEYLPPA